jgi:hypothetical protein
MFPSHIQIRRDSPLPASLLLLNDRDCGRDENNAAFTVIASRVQLAMAIEVVLAIELVFSTELA